MQNVSEDQDRRQPTASRQIRPDHTFKYIMLISEKTGGFLFKIEFQSVCICKRRVFISFLLFSGHNFPSLNPSISDKENIQTLAKDSGVGEKFWSIKHKIDVKHIDITILSSRYTHIGKILFLN